MQFDWLTVAAQNFTRCVVEISTILVFILDYFQEKLTRQNVLKNPNKTYFVAILGPFCPNLGKNEFSWKKNSRQFFDI